MCMRVKDIATEYMDWWGYVTIIPNYMKQESIIWKSCVTISSLQ